MIVISFVGGPGVGKSGRAARLFSDMKALGMNCELIPEFAKELTWADRYSELSDQLFVFAHQYHALRKLENKVDIAILDGSLLHNLFYRDEIEWGVEFEYTVMKAYRRWKIINVFVVRNLTAEYQTTGRKEDYEFAQDLDRRMTAFMKVRNINYTLLDDNNQDEVLGSLVRFMLQRGMGMGATQTGSEDFSDNFMESGQGTISRKSN